jgi:hypothetical protein
MNVWRGLKVGDRVRLVEIPPELLGEGYYIHRDTKRVYKKLFARGRSVRVFRIDEWGAPWIRCGFRKKSGGIEWHDLTVTHSGLARVNPRKKSAKL